ncbi:MAG: ABC transporter substrate-binding protein, partial [Dehalococcoidales bacterium]|nr:ABC transporter substrate-binding protein [Dehalococcoidales bacterium]
MEDKVSKRHITRRDFLKLGTAVAGVGMLQACSAAAEPTPVPQPTKGAAAPQATAAPTQAPSQPQATQAPAATKASGPKTGGEIIMAQPSAISEFSPARPGSRHSIYFRAVFNTLVQYDANLQPQPDLAEKWDVAADGKSITLKLRQGVKFHSGREVTAADVKNTVEFLQTPEAAFVAA